MENNAPNYYDEYEIDLREYIILLWNHKWFIIGLTVLAMLAAFLASNFVLDNQYQTRTRIQLSNFDGLYSEPNTAVQLLTSTRLVRGVMEELNHEFTDARLNSYINNNINVNQIGNTSIINITVNGNDAEMTKNVAELLINNHKEESNSYFSERLERERNHIADLENELAERSEELAERRELLSQMRDAGNIESSAILVQEISSLQNSRSNLRDSIRRIENEIFDFYPLEILDPPYLPENPTSPNTKLNIAIAAVLAVMMAVFIVFFKEFMKEE